MESVVTRILFIVYHMTCSSKSLRHRGSASHVGKVSFLSFPFFLVLRIVVGELGALVSLRGILATRAAGITPCWARIWESLTLGLGFT